MFCFLIDDISMPVSALLCIYQHTFFIIMDMDVCYNIPEFDQVSHNVDGNRDLIILAKDGAVHTFKVPLFIAFPSLKVLGR